MKRFLSRAATILLLIALLSVICLPASAADDYIPITLQNVTVCQTSGRSMLQMINDFRADPEQAWQWNSTDTEKISLLGTKSMNPLTYDYTLEAIATQRAIEIALFYSHTRPDDSGCFTLIVDGRKSYGENIAYGYSTEASVMAAWAETDEAYAYQGHRRNMQNASFTAVGFGHVKYNGINLWVQEFGYSISPAAATEPRDETLASVDYLLNPSLIQGSTMRLSRSYLNTTIGASAALPTASFYYTLKGSNDQRSQNSASFPVDITWEVTEGAENVKLQEDGTLLGINSGSATLTATMDNMYGHETATLSVTIPRLYLTPDNTTIAFDAESYVHNGKDPVEPAVTVTRDGQELVRNRDFTVEYSRNVDAGSGFATINGTGNYAGTIDKYFTIKHDMTFHPRGPATCEEYGSTYNIYTCPCTDTVYSNEAGSTFFDPAKYPLSYFLISPKGHTSVTDAAVPATCTATGLTEGSHCSVCSKVLVAQETIEKIAHTEQEIPAVPATCTSAGSSAGIKCSVCDTILVEPEEIAQLAHTIKTLPAVESTCTKEGLTEGEICESCKTVLTEQKPVAMKAHTPKEIPAVEATCTATGLTAGSKCSVCDTVLTAQTTIAKKAHTPKEIPAVSATCTEDGSTAGSKCSVCDTIITAPTTVNKLGHDSRTVEGYAATCTKEGLSDGAVCNRCGTTLIEQKPISTIAHTPEEIPAVEATCTATGLTAGSKCSVCQTVLQTPQEVSMKAHTVVTDERVEATCTATGLTEGSHCSVCSKVLVAQETIEKIAHTEQEIPAVPATCTNAGSSAGIKCSVCDTILVEPEEIAQLAHTIKTIPGKEATCSETGLTDGSECEVCGTVLVEQEIIEKISHTREEREFQPAGVDSEGCTAGARCSVCGTPLEGEVIPAVVQPALTAAAVTYNGQIRTPVVAAIVDANGNELVEGQDYEITYPEKCKLVGKYKVTVTFTGNYESSEELEFTIKPPKTSISKLTAGKKSFTAKWSKKSSQVTGYQIQYSKSKTFSSAKTSTISKYRTVSKTIKKLTGGARYYVRIRTYKTVNGVKIYSDWSSYKSIKTKK